MSTYAPRCGASGHAALLGRTELPPTFDPQTNQLCLGPAYAVQGVRATVNVDQVAMLLERLLRRWARVERGEDAALSGARGGGSRPAEVAHSGPHDGPMLFSVGSDE
jgi:hypothetical protein